MRSHKTVGVTLWVLQVLMALFFILASGAPKLFVAHDLLPTPVPLSSAFIYFIGICEVLGGLALVLPGALHRWTGLTPLAALCLVLLTICAAGAQLIGGSPGNAVFALAMGVICALIAYGRWHVVPLRDSAAPRLQAA
jgi:uncharacterized membrane protein